jgi:acyl-phosphate glycerol 3-phosphate acyltransferase
MIEDFNIILYISLILLSYLIGSISSSIIIGNKLYGIDVRNYGSKNPGANNTQRVLGWKMGLIVLSFDIFKGAAAVCLVFLTDFKPETNIFVSTQIVFGISAMLGHIFPLYHNFKGGKGVATLCGALLAIHPYAVLFCAAIFLIVLFITRYVSVSVITAVTCFPFMVNFLFALWLDPKETLTLKIFSIIAGLIIWLTHISNIKRLIKGKEEKFYIKPPVPTQDEAQLTLYNEEF